MLSYNFHIAFINMARKMFTINFYIYDCIQTANAGRKSQSGQLPNDKH